MAGLCNCWSGKRACIGYADGVVKLLDLKSGVSLFSLTAGQCGHDAEVTSIDCHLSDNVLLTGSIDCTALLINVHTGKVTVRPFWYLDRPFFRKSCKGGYKVREKSSEVIYISSATAEVPKRDIALFCYPSCV